MRIVNHGKSAGGVLARGMQRLLQRDTVSESQKAIVASAASSVPQCTLEPASPESQTEADDDANTEAAPRDPSAASGITDSTKAGICRKKTGTLWSRSSHRQIHTSAHDETQGITLKPKAETEIQKYPNPDQYLMLSPYSLNGNRQDLKRFLEEVGTDPKEARYWLKQFQSCSESDSEQYRPFAIVQVDSDVFHDKEMMHSLASCLSFLQRHNMKCVIVHGHSSQLKLKLQDSKRLLAHDSRLVVSTLEHNGAHARPLFVGNGILQAVSCKSHEPHHGTVQKVDRGPIEWALLSGHIPVIQSLGETASGQLVTLEVEEVTAALSRCMQPRKVIFVNTCGGIVDEKNEVIPNINLPDMEMDSYLDKPWCSAAVKRKLVNIESLLSTLPPESAVVITSAGSILTELFTHHGSGTFFKITEPIIVYDRLDCALDTKRLLALFNRSFGKDLKEEYFDIITPRLHRLYLTEEYGAAAIITMEEGIEVPYLDKFAVSLAKQSEGIGELLWQSIQKEFKQLFWRSRITNKINSWYFKKSEGSWSNGEWIVFWYGVPSHRDTSQLIDHALELPCSFKSTGSGVDNTQVE